MGIQLEKTKYEPVPGGTYQAKVKDVQSEPNGQYGPQLRISFEITGGDGDAKTLSGWCSARYSDKSKLGQWTRAILGQVPDLFDSDLLLNRACRISVSERLAEDGSTKNRIESVLPVRF